MIGVWSTENYPELSMPNKIYQNILISVDV